MNSNYFVVNENALGSEHSYYTHTRILSLYLPVPISWRFQNRCSVGRDHDRRSKPHSADGDRSECSPPSSLLRFYVESSYGTVPITTYIAGIGASWWSVGGQLLTSLVILVSVKQDIGFRAHAGAAFGSFMVILFGVSALVTAIRANIRSEAVICALVLCLEAWLLLRWVLRPQSKRNSQ
jgi:hypothetical protein